MNHFLALKLSCFSRPNIFGSELVLGAYILGNILPIFVSMLNYADMHFSVCASYQFKIFLKYTNFIKIYKIE